MRPISSVEKRDEPDALASFSQLPPDFERDKSAKGQAAQLIGSMLLNPLDFQEVFLGQFLDGFGIGFVHIRSSQPVDRLVIRQGFDQIAVVEQMAASSMYAKKRSLGAGFPDRDDVRPIHLQ